jgi:hypothetical protein
MMMYSQQQPQAAIMYSQQQQFVPTGYVQQSGYAQPQIVFVQQPGIIQHQQSYVNEKGFNIMHFGLGCLFGWFFGIFGIICIAISKNSGERRSYLAGWGGVMCLAILVVTIYLIIYFTVIFPPSSFN